VVDVARNAGAVDGIFDGLSYVSSVVARQPDADGLSPRWFATFAGAVGLIWLPCGGLGHPASAAASRQSVDLFFVGARHDAAFVRFRYLQYLDGFVGCYETGLGVTHWFFACSAAGAASLVALFFGRRIIPLALVAKNDAILGLDGLAFNLGAQAFITSHALALAALLVKRIRPFGPDLVPNTVDDAIFFLTNREAFVGFAAAFAHDLFFPFAFAAWSDRDRGTRPPHTFVLGASA